MVSWRLHSAAQEVRATDTAGVHLVISLGARGGEYITLDVLSSPSPDWTNIEMVLFVDAATELILRRSKFTSFLSENWVCRKLAHPFYDAPIGYFNISFDLHRDNIPHILPYYSQTFERM